MRFASVAAALAASALFSPAAAQQTPAPNPREIAMQVAQAVDENYFDATRGHAIAEGLRAHAQSGD